MPKVSHKDKGKQLVLHPNSRKTAQLSRKTLKATTREKSKMVYQVKLNLLGEKVLWFKENLLPDVDKYTAQQMIDVIELYLQRFEEEQEQITLKHSIGQRKGRQHASREDIIRLTITQEEEDFKTCGIECPDIMNAAQMCILRDWGGELRYLQNFKLRRFSKPSLLQQASKSLGTETAASKTSNASTSSDKDSTPTDPTSSDQMDVA